MTAKELREALFQPCVCVRARKALAEYHRTLHYECNSGRGIQLFDPDGLVVKGIRLDCRLCDNRQWTLRQEAVELVEQIAVLIQPDDKGETLLSKEVAF
jgi:hypothetical protein